MKGKDLQCFYTTLYQSMLSTADRTETGLRSPPEAETTAKRSEVN